MNKQSHEHYSTVEIQEFKEHNISLLLQQDLISLHYNYMVKTLDQHELFVSNLCIISLYIANCIKIYPNYYDLLILIHGKPATNSTIATSIQKCRNNDLLRDLIALFKSL